MNENVQMKGSGQDPESQAGRQAGRQSDGYIWWLMFGVETVVETIGGVGKRMNEDRIC